MSRRKSAQIFSYPFANDINIVLHLVSGIVIEREIDFPRNSSGQIFFALNSRDERGTTIREQRQILSYFLLSKCSAS